MKMIVKLSLHFASLFLIVFAMSTQAQFPSQLRYKDVVGENPNAEADIKVVSDYINSLVSGNLDKAITYLADSFKGFGPSASDSANSTNNQ